MQRMGTSCLPWPGGKFPLSQATWDYKDEEEIPLLTFGRHKGRHMKELDNGYLQWILEHFPDSSPWQKAAAGILAERGKTKAEDKVVCNARALLTDLKSCGMRRDLQWGRRLHAKVALTRNDSNLYVLTALIKMYSKCESMVDAHRVFDSIRLPDVVSWNALLLGYAENGEGHVALDLFSTMKSRGCAPDSATYVAALKACTSLAANGDGSRKDCLERGRLIHSEVGSRLNLYVQNTLLDMYANSGSMADARCVFDSIQRPDVVSWNALLLGYAENGEGHSALDLFSRMKAQGSVPDSITYVAAVKACASLADGSTEEHLERGRQIHMEIGCHLNRHVQNSLIDMYSKFRSMVEARRVFESIRKPNVVSWNALLLGYAENGQGHIALELFSTMKERGCAPNSITYVAALKACTSLPVSEDGISMEDPLRQASPIESEIGCHLSLRVLNTLIDMYSKLRVMSEARRVFDGIQQPNVVSWNALIMGYVDNGDASAALELFSRMKSCGCAPDSVTYLAALKAVASMATSALGSAKGDCLERGREIHLGIGCHLNQYVQNTLIDMYAKCGSMVEAQRVFDGMQNPSVVSWNALLLGYVENGNGFTALDLFSKMKTSGCAPDSVSYVAALRACASLAAKEHGRVEECLERGRDIHLEIGCHLNYSVQTTLIDMYSKCRSMSDARNVFEGIQTPGVASWNALLLGYVENGKGHVALDLFSGMRRGRCEPDSVTYIAAFKACGLIGSLSLGRRLHSELRDFTPHLVTSLVDFYAKCGSMVEAQETFDLHASARDVSTWNALLAGYGSFGDSISVFNLFETMQDKGFRPNAVTFVCVLLSCSHAGLVEKAQEYLELMPVKYGITPTIMHYTCVLDVLGRGNQLSEAIAMLQKMPCAPDAVTWRTLLGASHKWMDVELGKLAFQSLVGMDRKDSSAYFLLANMYSSKGVREELDRRQRLELEI